MAGLIGLVLTGSLAASAQTNLPGESLESLAYIFNTLWFVLGGALIMFMAIGFSLLEAGMVHRSSMSAISLKNIVTFAIACTLYAVIGYGITYPADWIIEDVAPMPSLFNTSDEAVYTLSSKASDIFFQTVFVATCASIVSGSLAERVKLAPYFIFAAILSGFLYPVATSWQWGGGWLSYMGFSDFAGGMLIHGMGGAAALAAAIVVGPRRGRFQKDRIVRHQPYSLALSTVGVLFLWVGFLGFNGGSQLSLGTAEDADSASRILLNTVMAGSGGTLVSLLLSTIIYGKADVPMVLNGTLGGLVILTAEPLTPAPIISLAIGCFGGGIVILLKFLLEAIRVDDVVGAIPVHLGCGVIGTMLVPLTNTGANFHYQAIGVATIFAWSFFPSLVIWLLLRAIFSVRVSAEQEDQGLDSHQVRTLV